LAFGSGVTLKFRFCLYFSRAMRSSAMKWDWLMCGAIGIPRGGGMKI